METDVQIRYTDEAKERLEIFERNLVKDIERLIKERKYIPGDDFIEVTGSDILYALKYIKITDPIQREFRYIIIYIYFLIGATSMFIGLYYERLKELFYNPIQAMLVTIGFVMIIASLFLLRFTAIRERRYKKMKDDDWRPP